MNHYDRPVILREGIDTIADLRNLKKTKPVWRIRDVYKNQLRELFKITNPDLKGEKNYQKKEAEFLADKTAGQKSGLRGAWIYYPWSGVLTHILNEEEYFILRTNRNRNLITKEEQQKLWSASVCIIGLSVGSSVASTLCYSGIAKFLKLAEFDVLETTNLNRIRARADQIGQPKLEIAAQEVWELDPFVQVSFYPKAVDKALIKKITAEAPKPKIIFEIIDSFEMKIHLRVLARERRLPVVMITNLGDRVLIDVERYDLNPKTKFFNGRAGTVPQKIIKHPDLTNELKHKYAVALAGAKNIPERALKSVAEIGKTLVGRPQLAGTVTVAAGFSAYLAKQIILGSPVSGSWLIDFPELFNPAKTIKT